MRRKNLSRIILFGSIVMMGLLVVQGFWIKRAFDITYKVARRIVVAVVGITVLIIGVILAMIIYSQLVKLPKFRNLRDRFFLRLPYIAYLVKLANTARFTRTMSILVSSGVTALDSMHISTEVINSSSPNSFNFGINTSRTIRVMSASSLA